MIDDGGHRRYYQRFTLDSHRLDKNVPRECVWVKPGVVHSDTRSCEVKEFVEIYAGFFFTMTVVTAKTRSMILFLVGCFAGVKFLGLP
jgi:hypothetical protein